MTDSTGDFETCSWCTAEVLDSTLTETNDGERVCPTCKEETRERFPDEVASWESVVR